MDSTASFYLTSSHLYIQQLIHDTYFLTAAALTPSPSRWLLYSQAVMTRTLADDASLTQRHARTAWTTTMRTHACTQTTRCHRFNATHGHPRKLTNDDVHTRTQTTHRHQLTATHGHAQMTMTRMHARTQTTCCLQLNVAHRHARTMTTCTHAHEQVQVTWPRVFVECLCASLSVYARVLLLSPCVL